MSDLHLLFNGALIYGLGLSLVLTAIVIFSGLFAPDMWASKYPLEIRLRFGIMSPRAARLRPFVAVVFFISVLIIPILGLFTLQAEVGYIPFLPALAFSAIVLLVFNVFDLIVLDWLIFCTIQPHAIVLPGTEGMPGYRDYRFHFIGFLKGFGFCAVGALFIAVLWMIVQGLVT
jgi:hypothetical protein